MNDQKPKSYEAAYEDVGFPCPMCGGNLEGVGVFSTGEPLDHYSPTEGELLKNRWMECRDCGFDQAS